MGILASMRIAAATLRNQPRRALRESIGFRGQCRSLAAYRRPKRKTTQQKHAANKQDRSTFEAEVPNENRLLKQRNGAESSTTSAVRPTWKDRMRLFVKPTRHGEPYTAEQVQTVLWRAPVAFGITLFAYYASPYQIVRIKGPSMLPTLSADGSQLWCVSRWPVLRHALGLSSSLQRGQVVGIVLPHGSVSCKRVIGLAGDTVPRYGQYVHLYERQDPQRLGVVWPPRVERVQSKRDGERTIYAWLDRDCPWDTGGCRDQNPKVPEARRTLVVPPNCVWVEADNPFLGVDSRHYGPVPLEWITGRLVARWWPLWKSDPQQETRSQAALHQRPHPISLDDDTLQYYNVHRQMPLAPDAPGV